MTENTKPLTEWEIKLLFMLNAAFLQAKTDMDRYITHLRAEHDAPAGKWLLRNPKTGFERVPKSQEKPARRRTKRKPKAAGVITEEGKESDAAND